MKFKYVPTVEELMEVGFTASSAKWNVRKIKSDTCAKYRALRLSEDQVDYHKKCLQYWGMMIRLGMTCCSFDGTYSSLFQSTNCARLKATKAKPAELQGESL